MTVIRTWVARALLIALLAAAACARVSAGDSDGQERCARDGGRWHGDFCERGGSGGY
jgi:hypothetical protein